MSPYNPYSFYCIIHLLLILIIISSYSCDLCLNCAFCHFCALFTGSKRGFVWHWKAQRLWSMAICRYRCFVQEMAVNERIFYSGKLPCFRPTLIIVIKFSTNSKLLYFPEQVFHWAIPRNEGKMLETCIVESHSSEPQRTTSGQTKFSKPTHDSILLKFRNYQI